MAPWGPLTEFVAQHVSTLARLLFDLLANLFDSHLLSPF
jgi:hypothetical protein